MWGTPLQLHQNQRPDTPVHPGQTSSHTRVSRTRPWPGHSAEDHRDDNRSPETKRIGECLLETYLIQVQLTAGLNTSSADGGPGRLYALKVKALHALTHLQPAERTSLPASKGALQHQFGQQIFEDVTGDKLVRTLPTCTCMPSVATWHLMTATKRSSCSGHLSEACSQGNCGSTLAQAAALDEAERVEHILQSPGRRHWVCKADLKNSEEKKRRWPNEPPLQLPRDHGGATRSDREVHQGLSLWGTRPRRTPLHQRHATTVWTEVGQHSGRPVAHEHCSLLPTWTAAARPAGSSAWTLHAL